MSHLRGIPTALRERFGVPVVYYDAGRADEPAGVRRHGHRLQHLPRRRSGRVRPLAVELRGRARDDCASSARGAPRRSSGAPIPELFAPLNVEKEHDVFFYAYGDKFRRELDARLIGEPSRRLPDVDFALGGTDFGGDVGRARVLGYFPVNLLSPGDLGQPHQPQRRPSAARGGAGVVDEPPLRARRRRRGDRDEPVRGHRDAGSSPGASCSSSRAPTRRSRRTGGCWTTRRRRRSSAGGPASASSRSTRSPTAHAGCSACSGSARPRQPAVRAAPRRAERRVPELVAQSHEAAVRPGCSSSGGVSDRRHRPEGRTSGSEPRSSYPARRWSCRSCS